MSEYLSVGVTPHPSSSALTPAEVLDPDLFDGDRMKSDVRMGILALIHGFFGQQGLTNSERWLHTWLAGSGASYRWHAALDLRDLDVLLGIDWIDFKRANPRFAGVSSVETAQYLNDMLRSQLWPTTSNWRGEYEMTFFVLDSPNIAAIRPYAAYDLDQASWTVTPDRGDRAHRDVPAQWEHYASLYQERANRAVTNYSSTLTELQGATNPAHRVNAEARFKYAVADASDLYQAVHTRRGAGFSPTGEGYSDLGNYLWQQGKAAGWIPALRQIHDYRKGVEASGQVGTYGLELPTADTLVARAAMMYGD